MKSIVNKDNCLIYGFPGIVILAIFLFISVVVGNDLGQSSFVRTVSFVGCNGLLWLLYLVLFQFLPVEILEAWQSKKKPTAVSVPETNTCQIMEETIAKETAQSVTPIPPLSEEQYKAYCEDFERQRQEARQQLTLPILDYVRRKMAPFTTEENLALLCEEMEAWCNNSHHIPQAIALKPISEPRDRLKTLDFKHLVWNIGARLGFDNGYSVQVQAEFIKKLFPKELCGIETISLARSLTCEPNKGHIKLDRPLHTDNYIFHF